MKRSFGRLASFALLGAILAAGAPAVAAAPAAHYSYSGMGAMTEQEKFDGDVVSVASVFVDLMDPATGDAQVRFDSQAAQLDADGNYQPLSMASSFGTIHLDIDARLTSAHASGTILVDSCQLGPDWWCVPGTESQAEQYLDVVWSSSSRQIKSHSIELASVTHTSRVIMNRNSAFRLADAVVTLDGVSVGAVGDPTETRIFDSSGSSVELYFGKDLPGVRLASLPATSGAPAVKPPSDVNSDQESIQAQWDEPDWLYLSVSSTDKNPGQGGERVVQADLYGMIPETDSDGNPLPAKFVEMTGTGTFEIDNQLKSGSFHGTVTGMACTSDWGWWICLDGVEIDVDATAEGFGPTSTQIDNIIQTGIDGTKYQSHQRSSTRSATVSATIDGQALAPASAGSLQQYTRRGWIYIP